MGSLAYPVPGSLPPAQFRVLVVSGSSETFVPSSFMRFEEAVALGFRDASHSVFMNYDQALKKGIADLSAAPKSPAESAREYRNARQRKTQAQSALAASK